jgi:hypothetical protein
MDERWGRVVKVREVRTRLALNELEQERQVQARAQAALEAARSLRADWLAQAARAAELAAPGSLECPQGFFGAAQAQEWLNFAAASRLKAKEAGVRIRRAQLQCERAQEGVAEAVEKYRREAGRRQALETRWQDALRGVRALRLEREEANSADERVGNAVARRQRDSEDHGDEL